MPTRRRLTRRLASIGTVTCAAAVAACATALAVAPAATAGTLRVKVCGTWSQDQGPFRAHTPGRFGWDVQCGHHQAGLELWFGSGAGSVQKGRHADWITTAPLGIVISHAAVVFPGSRHIDDGYGWSGTFFWNGGHIKVTRIYRRHGCCHREFHSRVFGWRITCTSSKCRAPSTLDVGGIELLAREDRSPVLAPQGNSNLWYERNSWVRGTWPVTFTATDPSGICRIDASLGQETLNGPASNPNRDAWQQCPERHWTVQVDTARAHSTNGSSEGRMPLRIAASNAAGVGGSRTEPVNVDNTRPWVEISGPSHAVSTAGTQFLRVTGGGSPSGIAGISCRVDRGPSNWYAGHSARVPVAGVGPHTITCIAENEAVDPAGHPGVSRAGTWNLTIRRPTRITAVFKERAHTVHTRTKRIPFGARTRIDGRLSVKGGRGLRNRVVRVMTVPDNGSKHYRPAATVRTGATGRWHATLPAGPSRLIKAVYGGSSTDEPATSPRARVIVPAKVKVVRLRPRKVKWGGTVHIDGRLAGGRLPPPPAGELVRLRLGYGRAYTTYGVKTDVTGNGRFKVSFTFGSGPASVVRHYWFEECALPDDDYPYAPACSRRITVRVGG